MQQFQWAPTLGGECYQKMKYITRPSDELLFQWAPTLGGECYICCTQTRTAACPSFNGHPPLGVNATRPISTGFARTETVSMGTHPWG